MRQLPFENPTTPWQAFLEVWGEGESWEEMCEAVASYPAERKAPYAAEDQVGRSG